MDALIQLDGPPSRWIADRGRPAKVCGKGGLPSYEHESGKGMVVFETLVWQLTGDGQARLFPRSYAEWSIVSPDGPVPLHHDPAATWVYRPLVYRLTMDGQLQAMGSQQEIQWRQMLHDVIVNQHVEEFEMPDYALADEKAERILIEHLNPQQRIEFVSDNSFRMRGGKTGNMYRVTLGKGFDLISRTTGQVMVSYCLHPEEFIPHADVALATKLWLEDPGAELECVGGSGSHIVGLGGRGIPASVFAERLERDLIP